MINEERSVKTKQNKENEKEVNAVFFQLARLLERSTNLPCFLLFFCIAYTFRTLRVFYNG